MSQNCPFCPDEPYLTPSQWGLSPEGWEQLKKNHEKNHVPQPTTMDWENDPLIPDWTKGLIKQVEAESAESMRTKIVELLWKEFGSAPWSGEIVKILVKRIDTL